ncbi:MAG TPA: inositol monophosphatase family protein [Thermodesulfovibrio thiophilus]|uniref:inositol monophosphatase family protein n=1 Tax=Thermodesulfovibrio thiophilus TaxID=340095 RepID=UPI0004114A4F|nr:inositol monophosphatase family protein [Thermodesulfovibrio thiophilus]HOA83146.1 inositol monophosphatase family protein [Thermodesulfovibrio thiophilus]HQA03783.1 inositol monophosphatase family protein [Thermodesulfovibrio thiophilus]HQD36382.1 inositol monophosphatase family protein [Thermodesulfovibrio thiophilus]
MKDYLSIGIQAAKLAGTIIQDRIGTISTDEITQKSVSDYVTDVDVTSEKTIIEHIKKFFPSHQIMAEESSNSYQKTEYLWIIDPLDGTTNFIHGFPVVAVSIALMHKGNIVIGVVYDPTRDELFYAEQGSGAFLNENRIKVSSIKNASLSLISTGFPFRNKQYIDQYMKIFRELLYSVSDLRRPGAAAIDLAYVASGRVDGFFEFALSPWDIAAGSILIKEAGGTVSDFEGAETYLKTGHIIAGNPEIHLFLVNKIRNYFL